MGNKVAESVLENKTSYFVAIREFYGENIEEKVREGSIKRIEQYFDTHGFLPKEKAIHVESIIVPIASIYLSLKEEVGREALDVIKAVKLESAKANGRQMDERLREIGSEAFFSWWEQYCRGMFGTENGFESVHYPADEKGVSLDVCKCPYCDTLKEMECFELISAFCDSDDYSYGNLSGVAFKRKGTLGQGYERCDFRLERAEI